MPSFESLPLKLVKRVSLLRLNFSTNTAIQFAHYCCIAELVCVYLTKSPIRLKDFAEHIFRTNQFLFFIIFFPYFLYSQFRKLFSSIVSPPYCQVRLGAGVVFMYFQLLRRTDYTIMGLRRLHLLISSDATELISSGSLLTGIKPRIKHLEREMTLQ